MENKKTVETAIFNAIETVNQQLPKDRQLAKSNDTILIGENSPLDSVGVVNLIVAVEDNIQTAFGTSITLIEDAGSPDAQKPLRTIGNLIDYVCLLLEKKSSA